MTLAWSSMLGWMGGATMVTVVVLLATMLHPIVIKICRQSDKPRSGTLEILSGGDDAKFE
jgi:Trk-type K+ transport system membrane component